MNLSELSGWEDQTLKKRMTQKRKQKRQGKLNLVVQVKLCDYFISSTSVKEQFGNLLDQLRCMCVHIQSVF